MASGDRSRTWFPEMIDSLRQSWRSDLRMDELIALAHGLDRMVHEIRTKRNIRPPMYRCPNCGERAPAGQPRVSVRATILAAGRFEIAPREDVKRLERLWKQHRMREALDLYGNLQVAGEATHAEAVEPHRCTGHATRAGDW